MNGSLTSFCWRVHLARREPLRAAAAALIIAAAAGWAFVLFRTPVAPAATAALLLAALAEFLFPVRYALTEEGAEARGWFYWRRISWAEVKRVSFGEQAIKLSPLARPSPREAFRGVLLRCDANRDEVLAAVHRFRGPEGKTEAGGNGSGSLEQKCGVADSCDTVGEMVSTIQQPHRPC